MGGERRWSVLGGAGRALDLRLQRRYQRFSRFAPVLFIRDSAEQSPFRFRHFGAFAEDIGPETAAHTEG